MGEFSIFHWLIVLAVVLIFFGGRRIPTNGVVNSLLV
jgi:Sec-independent protein translocase protein TatA